MNRLKSPWHRAAVLPSEEKRMQRPWVTGLISLVVLTNAPALPAVEAEGTGVGGEAALLAPAEPAAPAAGGLPRGGLPFDYLFGVYDPSPSAGPSLVPGRLDFGPVAQGFSGSLGTSVTHNTNIFQEAEEPVSGLMINSDLNLSFHAGERKPMGGFLGIDYNLAYFHYLDEELNEGREPWEHNFSGFVGIKGAQTTVTLTGSFVQNNGGGNNAVRVQRETLQERSNEYSLSLSANRRLRRTSISGGVSFRLQEFMDPESGRSQASPAATQVTPVPLAPMAAPAAPPPATATPAPSAPTTTPATPAGTTVATAAPPAPAPEETEPEPDPREGEVTDLISWDGYVGWSFTPPTAPKLDFRPTLSFGISEQSGGVEQTFLNPSLGAMYRYNPKVAFFGSMGADLRRTDSTNAAGEDTSFDQTAPTFDLGVTWQVDERTSLGASVSRSTTPSALLGQSSSDTTSFSVTAGKQFAYGISASMDYSYQTATYTDSTGQETVIDPEIPGSGIGAPSNLHRFSFTVGRGFELRGRYTLNASLFYQYVMSESDDPLSEYDQSITGIRLGLGF